MQWLIRGLLIASCALAAGCDSGPANLRKKVFGSPQAIDIVRNAKTVTAFRLSFSGWYSESLSDYEVTAGPIDVSGSLAAKMKALLLYPSSYGWDYDKGCEPNYGVRIQFENEAGKVDILFCFECDILKVYHDGIAVGGEDFDDARAEILTIIKELFPADEALQSLPL